MRECTRLIHYAKTQAARDCKQIRAKHECGISIWMARGAAIARALRASARKTQFEKRRHTPYREAPAARVHAVLHQKYILANFNRLFWNAFDVRNDIFCACWINSRATPLYRADHWKCCMCGGMVLVLHRERKKQKKKWFERARVIKLYTRLQEWENWSTEMAKATGFSCDITTLVAQLWLQ